MAAGLVLGARAVVPIHYGVSIPGDYEEYPRAEEVFLETARRRGLATLLMADGETLDWGAIR